MLYSITTAAGRPSQHLAAGFDHTCALLSGVTMRCRGYNYDHQLGNGTTTDSTVPVTVTGLAAVTAITAGSGHTCALPSGGTMHCWGSNYYGQLANCTTTDSSVPVTVTVCPSTASVSSSLSSLGHGVGHARRHFHREVLPSGHDDGR